MYCCVLCSYGRCRKYDFKMVIWQYDELRIFLKELLLTLLHLMRNTLLVILLLWGSIVSSQQFSIYQGITTANGLPSNYVFSVCEDEKGYLWVGTDKGLCRYNGFSWQTWDKDNGLPGNYVNSVFADKRGGLWLGISEKGVFHFDILKGVSTKITTPQTFLYNPLKTDAAGNLLIESAKGDTIFGYLVQPEDLSNPVKVYEYESKPEYVVHANPMEKKVFCIYPGNKASVPTIKTLWKVVIKTMPHNEVPSLVYYASDRLIITSTKSIEYDIKGNIKKVLNLFNTHNTYAVNCITANGYYVSNIRTGYYFVNEKGVANFYNGKSGLGSDYIDQLYELKDGTIVFATLGAGLQFKRNEYKRTYLTGNRIVRSILKEGNEWYTLAGETVLRINEKDSLLTEVGAVQDAALSMYKKNDQLIIGSLKGINFYSLNKGIKPQNFIPYNSGVSSIIQNGDGYYASTYGNGFISFNNKGSLPIIVSRMMPIIEKTLPLKNGYALLSYEDGIILVDTIQSRQIQLTLKDGLLSNSIHFIHEQNGTYYIGSKGGLSVYRQGRVVQTLSYGQGFTGNKVIYSFHDRSNRLWVVSDAYLHLFDGQKLRVISSYPIVSDADDIINTACYDAATNQLATGSNKNISILSIAGIEPNDAVTLPAILQTSVDGKVHLGNNLKVPYDFNTIAFSIAPFATSPLAKNKFLYLMRGRDKVWKEVKDSLSITYSGLRPGRYQLMAKIINPDGYESTETQVAAFTVTKPFWQTGWLIVLVIIVTSLLTVLFSRLVEATRQRKRNAAILLDQSLRYERERISKDLHDHLGSNLVNIVAQVDTIENRLNRKSFPEAIISVQQLSLHAREVINVLRETVWAVQENEHSMESFVIRIRTFLQRMYESTSITWQVKISPGEHQKLSSKQTLHLFRIIQEATQNILKHSKANTADYLFSFNGKTLEIIIADNGIGFNGSYIRGQGLANMRQRAKDMNAVINIEANEGTVITMVLPALP